MSKFIKFRNHPLIDYLTDNWQAIRDEYIAWRQEKFGINLLVPQDHSNKPNGLTYHKKQKLFEGNIHACALFFQKEVLSSYELVELNWRPDETVRYFQDNIDNMPTIGKWLSEWRDELSAAVFYTAQPGCRINHHYGVDTQRHNFRVHLCLTEDSKCVFDIENERQPWRVGNVFGFDDNAYYHGMKHEGTVPRSIFVFDVKKTLLEPFAIDYTPAEFIPHHERSFPPMINDW